MSSALIALLDALAARMVRPPRDKLHARFVRFRPMRLEVHVHADIPMLEGVSRKQIEQALAPWLEYLDAEALADVKSLEADEPGVRFDEKELMLLVCWTGEIGRRFYAALAASLENLGPSCYERVA